MQKNTKYKTYSQACAAVKHLLPDGCRFLKVGEPIPAGTKYIDENGKIGTNTIGFSRLAAIHCPHFVNVDTETASDKILKAFELEIKLARKQEKAYGEAKAYTLAAKYTVRTEILDEALGIAMRAVRS